MTTCTVSPAGWKCSREPGHDGPCAASRVMPYDEYVDKVIESGDLAQNIEYRWHGESITHFNLPERELRRLLTEAWMDGLKHSLVMIESEKRRLDEQD